MMNGCVCRGVSSGWMCVWKGLQHGVYVGISIVCVGGGVSMMNGCVCRGVSSGWMCVWKGLQHGVYVGISIVCVGGRGVHDEWMCV